MLGWRVGDGSSAAVALAERMAKAMMFGGAGKGKELQEDQFRGWRGLFQ